VTHPQVQVEHGGYSAEVDAELAPLILELWRAEIWTSLSCQEGVDGRVWIEFEGESVERFLSIAAGAHDAEMDSLYNRVVGGFEPDEEWEEWRKTRAWSYTASVEDANVKYEQDGETVHEVAEGGPDVRLLVSVRFPRTDLLAVLARVKAHNRSHAPSRRA
jgi:hypothetical protein